MKKNQLELLAYMSMGELEIFTQINNKFLDSPNNFDVAIWVVVCQDLQPQKFREKIGKKKGLFDESWKN